MTLFSLCDNVLCTDLYLLLFLMGSLQDISCEPVELIVRVGGSEVGGLEGRKQLSTCCSAVIAGPGYLLRPSLEAKVVKSKPSWN